MIKKVCTLIKLPHAASWNERTEFLAGADSVRPAPRGVSVCNRAASLDGHMASLPLWWNFLFAEVSGGSRACAGSASKRY